MSGLPSLSLPTPESTRAAHRLDLDFFGVGVRLITDDERFERATAAYLNRYRIGVLPAGEPAIVFHIETADPPAPEALEAIRARGGGLREGDFEDRAILEVVAESEAVAWVITPKALARVDLAQGAVQGFIFENRRTTVDNMRHVVCVFFVLTLLELLKSHRLFYLHGAALIDPRGRMVLLPGKAGDGKTTITVSLVESGWRYLSDDAVFLEAQESGVRVHGFHKGFHVDPGMAAHYPRLERLASLPAYLAGNPKREIDPRELYPDREIESTDAVAALLFPQIVASPLSEIRPMGPGDALAALLHISPMQVLNGRRVRSHLAALKALTGARCGRLRHGADCRADPSRYAPLIGRFLDGEAA